MPWPGWQERWDSIHTFTVAGTDSERWELFQKDSQAATTAAACSVVRLGACTRGVLRALIGCAWSRTFEMPSLTKLAMP